MHVVTHSSHTHPHTHADPPDITTRSQPAEPLLPGFVFPHTPLSGNLKHFPPSHWFNPDGLLMLFWPVALRSLLHSSHYIYWPRPWGAPTREREHNFSAAQKSQELRRQVWLWWSGIGLIPEGVLTGNLCPPSSAVHLIVPPYNLFCDTFDLSVNLP